MNVWENDGFTRRLTMSACRADNSLYAKPVLHRRLIGARGRRVKGRGLAARSRLGRVVSDVSASEHSPCRSRNWGHDGGCVLAQAGHRVVMLDQFTAPQPVGAGLVSQPVRQADLDRGGAWIHRVTGIEVASGREVMVKGGAPGRFDLVVDAAGAGSALSPLKARALSFGAIWGTVPWPEGATLPQDALAQRYRRADRMAG